MLKKVLEAAKLAYANKTKEFSGPNPGIVWAVSFCDVSN